MSKNNSGQTLFEVVVGLAVVGIVLIALASLSVQSVGNTNFSVSKSQATRLTQEGSEWIRNQRDLDWDNLANRVNVGGQSTYCLNNLSWNSGACNSSEKVSGTEFYRQVTLRGFDNDGSPGLDTVSVGVVTYWVDSVGRREARTTTLLSNWKN